MPNFQASPTGSGLLLPNSVSVRPKPSDDISQLDIFARNGVVCFNRPDEHGRDYDFKQCSVTEAELRLSKLIEIRARLAKHALTSSVAKDKLGPISKMIEKMRAAIGQAREQGPPEYADMRRHRVRAMPVSISVPEMSSDT